MTPYADTTYADAYFSNLLMAEDYENADPTLQVKALSHATLLIDNLGYKGSKTSSSQERKFPRDVTGDVIPDAIKDACCEIALKLLEDYNPNEEALDLNIISEGYANVRTTRDSERVPEYLYYGIPCLTAWLKIKPYVTENKTVKLLKS